MILYGSCLRADSLSNIPLNGDPHLGVKIRFQATRGEPLVGIQLTSPIRTGYTAGNGGDILATLIHLPTGEVHEATLFEDATHPYGLLLFQPATALIAGDWYELLIRNVADVSATNWRSVDGFLRSAIDPNDPPCLTEMLAPGGDWAPHPGNQPMWQAVCHCSECTRTIEVGQLAWVSRSKSGKVAKRVCSEDCGQKFDYRAMSHQAWLRERGQLTYPSLVWPA